MFRRQQTSHHSPPTRTFKSGDEEVTEQLNPDGSITVKGRSSLKEDKPEKAATKRGEVEQDFRNGFITRRQADARLAQIDAEEKAALKEEPKFPPSRTFVEGPETVTETLNPDGSTTVVRAPRFKPDKDDEGGPQRLKSSDVIDGFVVTDNGDGTFRKTKVLDFKDLNKSKSFSAVTTQFRNGTVQQAAPNGKTIVRDPSGNVVEGDERLKVLKEANQNELKFERAKSGQREAGKQAITKSGEAFDQVAKIKIAVQNIDNAIQAIDDGAKTGPILSKLPSVRAASIQLDNIRGKLGLDVLGSTTFGALSEAELAFALSTALPTNLGPQDLRKWLVQKRDVQTKLADYLQDVSI